MPHSGFAAPKTKVAVTEIREITYKGELLGRPEVKVEHADGTYTTTVPLHWDARSRPDAYDAGSGLKDWKEISGSGWRLLSAL